MGIMKRIYWSIPFFLCMMLSVALYMQVPDDIAHFDVDSFGYHELAVRFCNTNTFINAADPLRAPVQPIGYPFFMGLLYKFFGIHVWVVIAAQVLLMICNIALLMLITKILFDGATAILCGFFAACNLSFLVYPQFILAETLLLFFLLFFMYCFVRSVQQLKYSIMWSLYAGLVLGISIIVKPTAFCLLFILVPVLIWIHRADKKCMHINVYNFISGFSIPIALYVVYNYYHYGYFAFAPMMPLNMYQCLLAKVMHRVTGDPVQTIIDTQLRFAADNSFDPAGWDAARQLFYKYLYEYPWIFVSVWMHNVAKTMFGLFSTQLKVLIEPGVQGGDCSYFMMTGNILERMHAYITYGITHRWLLCVAYVEVIWSGVRSLLFFVGCGLLWYQKKYGLVSIFVVCIMLLCMATGMDGCCRYRMVCEPLLVMIVAYACMHFYRTVKKRFCV